MSGVTRDLAEPEMGGRAVVGESLRFYLPALDGLRFFAFVLVLLHHLSLAPAFMSFFNSHGWIGVELFFAISSFLFFRLLVIEDAAEVVTAGCSVLKVPITPFCLVPFTLL